MNSNLRHVFSLVDIADTGRLSAAAERVFLSQSALTQALRKLEQSAGEKLFDRSGFGVTETRAGTLLIRRARRGIGLFTAAEREIGVKRSRDSARSPLHRHVTAGQLRALVAVVETGGYSTAARQLGKAQPTVHRAVKDLESMVGVEMFPRTARGVVPSDAAKTFARYANLVLAEVRQGFEEVWEQQGRSDSRVAIGSLPLARSKVLPTAVT